MNQHQIVFKLTDQIKIVIDAIVPLKAIHCCSEAKVFLVCNNQWRLFGEDSIKHHLEILKYQLQKALDNQLQLHPSITKDIGALYNEYKQEIVEATYEKFNNNMNAWVGDRYELWGYGLFTAWLYNDIDESIVIEFSDIYPKIFIECVPIPERSAIAPFKQWMQTYKPYLTHTIPKKIGQQWLEKVKSILVVIEKASNQDITYTS